MRIRTLITVMASLVLSVGTAAPASALPAVAGGLRSAVVAVKVEDAKVPAGTADMIHIHVHTMSGIVTVQRITHGKCVSVIRLQFSDTGKYDYQVTSASVGSITYRLVVAATLKTRATTTRTFVIHWYDAKAQDLPRIAANDITTKAVQRLLAGIATKRGLWSPCIAVYVLGARVAQGDLDVEIGDPAADCGGDPFVEFDKIRAGTLVATASACEDCTDGNLDIEHLEAGYNWKRQATFHVVAGNGSHQLWAGELAISPFAFQPGSFGPINVGATFTQVTALLPMAGLNSTATALRMALRRVATSAWARTTEVPPEPWWPCSREPARRSCWSSAPTTLTRLT